MLLAELTTPTEGISTMAVGLWILIAFVVLNGLATLVMLVKILRNDPEKRDVSIVGNTATKAEFDLHVSENKRDHEGLHSKIGGVDRGARSTADERYRDLHTQFLQLHSDVGAVKAQNETQTQRIASLDAKVETMPDRIVALLKNTGSI